MAAWASSKKPARPQFYRDVRVTAIYEGTNGIQAMDLVARKLMDGGDAAYALLDEIEDCAEKVRESMADLAEPLLASHRDPPGSNRMDGGARRFE